MFDRLPLEILEQIAGDCESLGDVAALVATCRNSYGLDGCLYQRDFKWEHTAQREWNACMRWAPTREGGEKTMEKWNRYNASKEICGAVDPESEHETMRAAYMGRASIVGAALGNSNVLTWLFDHGLPKNYRTTDGWTPLMSAIHHSRLDTAKMLIERDCGVNMKWHQRSPVQLACKLGDAAVEVVGMLLDRQVEIYPPFRDGSRPMRGAANAPGDAAASGSVALLRLFVDRGLDLCGADHFVDTELPVATATAAHQYEALEFLLRGGFYPPWDSRLGQQLMEHLAKQGSTPEALRLFFEHTELSVRSVRRGVGTMLYMNVHGRGNVALTRFLVQQGADVNACGEESSVPVLAHAVAEYHLGNCEAFDILMASNMDVSRHFGPVEAAINFESEHCFDALLQAGADLTLKGTYGKTPLMVAAAQSFGAPFVERILAVTAGNINDVDNHHNTALFHAVISGSAASVRLLAARGADLNRGGATGCPPICFAVYKGNEAGMELVRALVEAGADIDAVDPTQGHSALMAAKNLDRRAMYAYLLEQGADVTIRANDGLTVEDLGD